MHYPVSSKLFVKSACSKRAALFKARHGFPTRLKLRSVAKPPQMIGIFLNFIAAANIPLAAELTARLGCKIVMAGILRRKPR
jgi:hypothetical protein